MTFTPFYQTELDALPITLDLAPRPSPLTPEALLALTARLSRFYQAMLADQPAAAPEYQPGGEWKNYNDEKSFLYAKLAAGDAAGAAPLLAEFWRNQLGLIVKEYAKFESLATDDAEIAAPFLRSIGRNFLIWQDLFHLPVERLRIATTAGNPWGCTIAGELVTPKATRFHATALQLHNLTRHLARPVVAEIGGGYGGMVPYFFRESTAATYIDFDLPETLVLHAFHVLNALPDRRIFLYGEAPLTAQSVAENDILLLPNYALPAFAEKSIDVFYNSFSLSEMPFAVMDNYLAQIRRLTRTHFLHNNMDRQGVVNRGFARTPASQYPMEKHGFRLLSSHYDLFHAHFGDYKEYLYAIGA